MIPLLVSVEAHSNYHLQLQFEDGTNGLIDVSNLAGKGVFKSWDQDDLFFRPYINEMGTVAWNDFLDIDLLNAYLTLKNSTFEDWKLNSQSHASD